MKAKAIKKISKTFAFEFSLNYFVFSSLFLQILADLFRQYDRTLSVRHRIHLRFLSSIFKDGLDYIQSEILLHFLVRFKLLIILTRL